jgi:hypothetical protein
MKKIEKVLAVVVIGLMILISGCEKTDEGVNTTDRDKFIGTWDGQSDGAGGHRNFSLVISASASAPDQIKMQGFDGGTGTIFANVSGNLFSIPSQTVSGETIKGDGSYSNASLTFTFSIDDGQTVENRTGSAANKH